MAIIVERVTRAPNVSVRNYYAGRLLKNENFLIGLSMPNVSTTEL
jgi:hypothetical protein